eukprot:3779033-Prymnesium_polylepis.1
MQNFSTDRRNRVVPDEGRQCELSGRAAAHGAHSAAAVAPCRRRRTDHDGLRRGGGRSSLRLVYTTHC